MQNRYYTAEEVSLPVPFLTFDLKGAVLAFGLVALVVTAHRRRVALHLLGELRRVRRERDASVRTQDAMPGQFRILVLRQQARDQARATGQPRPTGDLAIARHLAAAHGPDGGKYSVGRRAGRHVANGMEAAGDGDARLSA